MLTGHRGAGDLVRRLRSRRPFRMPRSMSRGLSDASCSLLAGDYAMLPDVVIALVQIGNGKCLCRLVKESAFADW